MPDTCGHSGAPRSGKTEPEKPPAEGARERVHLRFRGPFPTRIDASALARLVPVLIAGLLLILTAVPWPGESFPTTERRVEAADEAQLTRLHARIAAISRAVEQSGFHWIAGMTGVSHLTSKEFHRLLGAQPPAEEASIFARLTAPAAAGRVADLPARWDWREAGALGAPRDQGVCGSCWAFCAAGAFEAYLGIYDARLVDLSEQHVLDCNEEDYDCSGGWMTAAYRLWCNWGALLESQLPYAAEDARPCDGNDLMPLAVLSGWETVSSHRTALQQAILTGPVAVAMHVYDDFQHYQAGIYEHAGSDGVNHAVLLVGWDDEREAWILRNSWGLDWGEQGYAYVRYDCCRLGTYAHRITLDATAPLKLVHEPLPPLVPVHEPLEIRVLATSPSGTLSEANLWLHYDTGQGDIAVAMELRCGNDFAATYGAHLPNLAAGTNFTYSIEARSAAGFVAVAPHDGTAPFASRAMRAIYETEFESPGNWQADPSATASAGTWQWGLPEGTLSERGVPVQPRSGSGGAGSRCFATGLLGGATTGDNDVDGGTAALLSPPLSLVGLSEVTLQCRLWFSNSTGAHPREDACRISGRTQPRAPWQPLIEIRTGHGGWTLLTLSLEQLGELTDAVQLRFAVADSLDDSIVEMALDDVQLLTSTPMPTGGDDNGYPGSPPDAAGNAINFHLGPNPSKGPTTLAFDLPQAAHVRAAIFDLTGRRLRVLADEWLPDGHHLLDWNGRDESGHRVGPGRYWARLSTPMGGRTKSLTILR